MNEFGERIVVYTVAGTIALTPIIHANGPHDEVKTIPPAEPHQYHVEVSSSAQPLILPIVSFSGSYWLPVEPARVIVGGSSMDLHLTA